MNAYLRKSVSLHRTYLPKNVEMKRKLWNNLLQWKGDDNRKPLFVGGMPEAILSYVNEKDLAKVRTIQNEILFAYKAIYSNMLLRMRQPVSIWFSTPYFRNWRRIIRNLFMV